MKQHLKPFARGVCVGGLLLSVVLLGLGAASVGPFAPSPFTTRTGTNTTSAAWLSALGAGSAANLTTVSNAQITTAANVVTVSNAQVTTAANLVTVSNQVTTLSNSLPAVTNTATLAGSQTFTGAKTFNAAVALGSGSGAIVGGLADISLTTAGGAFVSYGSGGSRGEMGIAPRLFYSYGGVEKFSVNSDGQIYFGDTPNDARIRLSQIGSTNVLKVGTYGLTDGAAIELLQMATPSVPSANSARIYAKDAAGTARLYTMAEDGTEFLISPHAKHSPGKALDGADPDPVVFHESNAFLGRERFVHLTAAVREIERLTGKRFIFDRDIPKKSWSEAQSALRREHERARLEEEATRAAGQAGRRAERGPKSTARSEFRAKPDPWAR